MNSIFLIEVFLGVFLLAALIRLFVNKDRFTTRRPDRNDPL